MTGSKPILRACAYVRVSTEDQADHRTSLTSQIHKIEQFCDHHCMELVEVFEEPGVSGKGGDRPQFNKMLRRALDKSHPYDLIVVNSLSRFARDLAVQTTTFAQLQAAGVDFRSVTENFDKGANGNLMRSMVGAFNQHNSDQCAMNTIRAMNANAMEGFFNGGPVPFGYQSIVVEKRGDKEKKKLEVVADEAEVVRKIFRLARYGDGDGPLGARGIAMWLNERGFTLRGGRFNNSNADAILKRTHYRGYYFDGKRNEFKEPIPEENWIKVPCPAIISEAEYLDVAALRAKRAPTVTPPRVTNGKTMLPASIARCGCPDCGEGLTVRTGRGGQYHYYSCRARVNMGAHTCNLRAIRREELDEIVIDQLIKRIFRRDRIIELLEHLLARSESLENNRRKDLAMTRSEITKVDKAISNLLTMIESGAMHAGDPIFVQRIAHNQARKSALKAEEKSLELQLSSSKTRIDEKMIEGFAKRISNALREGDPKFRAAYVRLFVGKVELTNDEVRIFGTKDALEKALVANANPELGEVPIFDRKWCRLRDSNT